MGLDEMVGSGFKQNRAVKYEKPEKSVAHKANYHYPSGPGFKNPTGGKVSPDAERGYHYPSGKGEKSPIVGKTISGRTARRG